MLDVGTPLKTKSEALITAFDDAETTRKDVEIAARD